MGQSQPTIERMHRWARAGDLIYCEKCGAGANDDPTQCPPVRNPIPGPRFYVARRPDHKQDTVFNPFAGEDVQVDHKLAMGLHMLWVTGYITEASCQGCPRTKRRGLYTWGYIKFYKYNDAKLFQATLDELKVKNNLERGNAKQEDAHTGVVRFHPRMVNKAIEACMLMGFRKIEQRGKSDADLLD